MKPSIDNIINELALRGLESQDHELFMRRVANAMNGHPKESMFFGRIIKFSLRGEEFLPDLFGEAKKNIWNQARRESAKMTDYSLDLVENGTAIGICFKFEAVDTNGNPYNGEVNLTVRQDNVYIDAFDYIVDQGRGNIQKITHMTDYKNWTPDRRQDDVDWWREQD